MNKKLITLTPLHKNYPKRLQNIPNKPAKIWIKGKDLSVFSRPSLAVIGSRKCTAYGRKVTRELVSGLVKAGVVIVSGMARGIDTLAHQAALKNRGQTIAVLGSGLKVVYPPENKKLFKSIDLVVSEYPPDADPEANHFLERNRIISGLSDGVLVIEAGKRSGTLNTAKHAAEQGKEMFAVLGPISSATSAGIAWLLNQGAKAVCNLDDVLDEMANQWQVEI